MPPLADFAAILLAAGFSRRMGGENKLLKDFGGKPLMTYAVDTIGRLGFRQIVVVLGEAADRIGPLLPSTATVIRNERAGEGMGASLAAGAAALDPALSGAFVVLADMPLVAMTDYQALADAFRAEQGEAICIPLHDGRRGHPVLFPARHFAELTACRGDSGARHLFSDPRSRLCEVEGCSPGVLADFDDPASFAAFEANAPSSKQK